MALLGSYPRTILHTFPGIKQYWHFQRVTVKQYYTLLQSLHQVILAFSELLANSVTHFSRAWVKQHWHFQGVIGKQYYTLFQSLYQAIVKSFFRVHITQCWHFQRVKTILTYLELMSNSIHTFSYYQTVVNTFLRVSVDTRTDRKSLRRKFPSKSVKS